MSASNETIIGVVIFCHGSMSEGMRNSAEMIIGPQKKLTTVAILPGDSRDKASAALMDAVKDVDSGSGVVILTDLPGGTPCNLTALELSENLEMITGFNLPLLVRILMSRNKYSSPKELAYEAIEYGRRHMSTGTELMQSTKES